MVWRLEAYDTETRSARVRRYVTSSLQAEAWERIPRIDFTDSGHGIVFQARRHLHGTKRLREINPYGYDEIHREKRREVMRERRSG